MRAGQKYFWPALFALERGRRGINVDYCCLAHTKQPFLPLVICLTTDTILVVVGNEEGIIGWGLGKAGEVTAAIAKGVESAKKNLVRVPILKGTVPHEQSARFGGAEVFIKPASHGTGVVAGGAMRAVLESVGVTDVLAKSKGSSNPHNLVKATIEALSEMRDARMVAQNRGISVEKVFRG